MDKVELSREQFFFWSNRVYEDFASGGGVQELSPEEAASVVQLGVKPISLPSVKKITINMEEVRSGHMEGGYRLEQSRAAGGNKDVFPAWMNERQVEAAIKEAYQNATKIGTQGEERVFLRGQGGGMTIEMVLNKVTKVIETAYPK